MWSSNCSSQISGGMVGVGTGVSVGGGGVCVGRGVFVGMGVWVEDGRGVSVGGGVLAGPHALKPIKTTRNMSVTLIFNVAITPMFDATF